MKSGLTVNVSFVDSPWPETKELIEKHSSLNVILIHHCSTEDEGVYDPKNRQANCRHAVEMSANADGIRSAQHPMGNTRWHDTWKIISSIFLDSGYSLTACHPFAGALPRNGSDWFCPHCWYNMDSNRAQESQQRRCSRVLEFALLLSNICSLQAQLLRSPSHPSLCGMGW